MAKVAFSKLNLKRNDDIKKINIGNFEIEVKQYLPIEDKLNLITKVIENSYDIENNFSNPIKTNVFGELEIIMAYTNLSFTDKQKEDISKLYDLLESNGIIERIISVIPQEEYSMIIEGINEITKSIYAYKNSVLGILDNISQDYSQTQMEATEIQKRLADPENLALIKDILTKIG